MKKQIFSLLILGSVICACSPEPSFEINGTINSRSGIVYLQNFRNKMFFVIDSAKIENGAFRFNGKVDRPDLYGITLNKEESFQPYFIFVENSKIGVTIDTANLRELTVTGSASQDLFIDYQKNRRDFNIDSFIVANPASTVAAYILYRDYATRLTADELESSLANFDTTLNSTSYIVELKEIIDSKRRVEIGQKAISFSGQTPDGKTVELTDFSGRYVLIEFWAAWCGPCRRENPNLVKAYAQFQPKGFQIFAVSLDNNREAWVKAIANDGLNWVHVSDLKFWDSEPAKIYGIRHIPSNILIDPNGIIVARNLKSNDLTARLSEVYSSKPTSLAIK